ncbi:DMT family transporter [Desulfotignum balticum]|uniref:DMT family transporter n=1 Tax=Desulfotignum balticum TaxID=115781 RepID=UPI0003F53C9D|nr:DMT family transporter [Desulfotignum balticum]
METTEKTQSAESVNRVMSIKEWVLIFILSIIWGGSFFFVGVAVKELPPLTIVLGRVALASVILLVIVYFKGKRMPLSLSIWGSFLVMGALNNLIPFCLIVWGQTHIESGLASILNATTPIFSVVLAHFFTREEKLTLNRISGIVLGWIGVSVLIGIESLRGFGLEVFGQIAVLCAAVSYAFAAIYGRRFKNMNPIVVATGMLCGSTIMMIPLTLYFDQPWNLAPGAMTIMSILGLAAISTSLAYIIYFHVLATAGPTNLLLVTFLIPISAIALGVMVLGEQLGWEVFVGMGIIFLGLITIDGRLLKKFKKKTVWYYKI